MNHRDRTIYFSQTPLYGQRNRMVSSQAQHPWPLPPTLLARDIPQHLSIALLHPLESVHRIKRLDGNTTTIQVPQSPILERINPPHRVTASSLLLARAGGSDASRTEARLWTIGCGICRMSSRGLQCQSGVECEAERQRS